MNNQAINLKAAGLCDLSPRLFAGKVLSDRGLINDDGFDIFTNPADREATVIALGLLDNIGICCSGQQWFIWDDGQECHLTPDVYNTYPEAIAAAVEAIDN